MSRDGAVTFGDLVGKLETLRVTCAKCEREGRYSVRRLIEQHGREGKVTDWLAGVAGDCPCKRSIDMSDQCRACCPDLVRVGLRGPQPPRLAAGSDTRTEFTAAMPLSACEKTVPNDTFSGSPLEASPARCRPSSSRVSPGFPTGPQPARNGFTRSSSTATGFRRASTAARSACRRARRSTGPSVFRPLRRVWAAFRCSTLVHWPRSEMVQLKSVDGSTIHTSRRGVF
jgi:hypothetical protein